MDLKSVIFRQQGIISELETELEEERRESRDAREMVTSIERRSGLVATDLCEAKNSLEMSEKARRAVEVEVHELGEKLSGLGLLNAGLTGQKRKLETDITGLQVLIFSYSRFF